LDPDGSEVRFVKRAILVPLDGTLLAEHAIPVAVAVARCTGAELHPVLVHLTDYFRDLGLTDASIPEMDRELTVREADYLTSIAERISGQEVSVQAPVVLHGDVPDAVVTHVARLGIDGIVMTSQGRGSMERLLVPSVAEGLRRRLTVPMILVRADPEKDLDAGLTRVPRLGTVLVALDGSVHAEEALEEALAICGSSASFVLLRVVSLPPLLSSVYLPQATILRHRDEEQLRAEAAAYLDGLEERIRGRAARVEKRLGVHSRPGHLIVRAAGEVQADLIAVGSHGHGAFREAIFGSTTRDVLEEARVPVLVTRAVG
jgi:nucleotide-binding universal stress UspA family protein